MSELYLLEFTEEHGLPIGERIVRGGLLFEATKTGFEARIEDLDDNAHNRLEKGYGCKITKITVKEDVDKPLLKDGGQDGDENNNVGGDEDDGDDSDDSDDSDSGDGENDDVDGDVDGDVSGDGIEEHAQDDSNAVIDADGGINGDVDGDLHGDGVNDESIEDLPPKVPAKRKRTSRKQGQA